MSFIYIFLSAFLENFIFKQVNKLENRNFHSSILFFISATVLLIVYFSIYTFNPADFSFLYETLFYFQIILELLVFYLYRENYYQNKDNYTMINMFVFSTIYLMPILAFTYNSIFIFNNSLDIKYDSFYEAFIFSLTLFILSLIYYLDKIRNKEIKNFKLLVLLLIVLLHSMYFSVKIIQTYNGFLIYSFIQFIVAIYFFILSNKEPKEISLKKVGLYLAWPFVFIFYVLAANIMAVEFITIFKRVSQILSAMILDRKILKKDTILIFSIVLISLIFYNYKV